MKVQLRAINPERLHARDLARKLVRRWKSDAERDRLPVANQHVEEVKPALRVDEVLLKSFKQIEVRS